MRCVDNKWDIRVNEELIEFFGRLRSKGAYYWKLSRNEGEELIKLLCDAYGISHRIPNYIPNDFTILKRYNAIGIYDSKTIKGTIYTYPRPHFKTLAHEVYHHIDYTYYKETKRIVFDSSDDKQYAYKFAELLWQECMRKCSIPVVIKQKDTTVSQHKVNKNWNVEVFSTIEELKSKFKSVGPAVGWRVPTTEIKSIDEMIPIKLPADKQYVRKTYKIKDSNQYVLQWIVMSN